MSNNEQVADTLPERLSRLSNATFWGWFFLFSASVAVSSIWVGSYFLFVLSAALVGVLFSLIFSRWLAKRAHNIHVINPESFTSENQQILYQEVAALCEKAGLATTPEIGIYDSPDMNAFATGATHDGALIAFSTGLLNQMPLEQVKAVAAHEIAHIVNRDMLGMVLMQGIINGIIIAFSFPIAAVRFLNSYSDKPNEMFEVILRFSGYIIKILLAFIGNIVLLAFSRHREYRADAFSSVLVGKDAMVGALTTLSADTALPPPAQAAYANFKVSGAQSFAELFSTHPLIEKRIAALDAGNPQDLETSKSSKESVLGAENPQDSEIPKPLEEDQSSEESVSSDSTEVHITQKEWLMIIGSIAFIIMAIIRFMLHP